MDRTVAIAAAPDPDATRDHRPPDRPWRAEVVAGTPPAGESGLVPLLRERLRFLLVVFAVYFLAILALQVGYLPVGFTARIDFWAGLTPFLVCLGFIPVLSNRPGLTLRRLRLIEFVLFAVFGVRVLLRGYVLLWDADYIDRARGWIAAGDREAAQLILTGLATRLTSLTTIFVVAYGVIIPNTWRRCGVVVAAFTALPVVIWLTACVSRGLPAEHWFPFQTIISFLTVALTAVLSAYGAYRIESSRRDAAEARRLGQYVLREKLGAGGMGEVYRADHALLRRPFAVKLIRPQQAGAPTTLERFEREVQATAGLTHPNTVQVYDYGRTDDGTFYYVMEYLPGITLDRLVAADGPLAPGRAVRLLRQVCGALAEAHAAGLVHRDVKPGNVLVGERGGRADVAKLLDFGLVLPAAASGDGRLTQLGTVAGTPAYMSPEQAGGDDNPGPAADVYAVGAVAYFLLTGRPPFAGRTGVKLLAAHLHELPEPPSAYRPGLPADLEAVVLRCLAKRPADRYPDAAALDEALAGCRCDGPS